MSGKLRIEGRGRGRGRGGGGGGEIESFFIINSNKGMKMDKKKSIGKKKKKMYLTLYTPSHIFKPLLGFGFLGALQPVKGPQMKMFDCT